MKALVGAFNQEKALVGAFSVIVQSVVEPMDRFTALVHIYSILHSAFQLSDRVSDIDRKIVMVSDKLNLMVENQEKLVKIHSKYRYRAPDCKNIQHFG